MIFQHNPEQTVHGTSAACDLLQDIDAVAFLYQSPLNGIDLSPDAAHTVENFLFVTDSMAHALPQYIGWGSISWFGEGDCLISMYAIGQGGG
jgi:hypothetical protein